MDLQVWSRKSIPRYLPNRNALRPNTDDNPTSNGLRLEPTPTRTNPDIHQKMNRKQILLKAVNIFFKI